MNKKFLLLFLMLMMVVGCGRIPTLENGEEAIVTFKGDEKISVDDVYKELKENYGLNILINKIDTYILEKEYPDADAETEDYVNSYINYIKSYYTEDEEYLSYLQESGFKDEETAKKYIGLNYLRNLAVEDYTKSLITDKEINSYYKDSIVGDIKCSHILIEPKVTDDMTDEEKTAAEEQALKTAQDLIKELKSSKDVKTKFAELAKSKSDDEGSAKDGGNLGFFNTGEMYTEFETAAFDLKNGEYTKTPIKTEAGYHIILRVETKEKASLESVKENVIQKLAENKLTEDPTIQIDALTELRKEYDVEINDSDLEKQYANYIQNSIANLK